MKNLAIKEAVRILLLNCTNKIYVKVTSHEIIYMSLEVDKVQIFIKTDRIQGEKKMRKGDYEIPIATFNKHVFIVGVFVKLRRKYLTKSDMVLDVRADSDLRVLPASAIKPMEEALNLAFNVKSVGYSHLLGDAFIHREGIFGTNGHIGVKHNTPIKLAKNTPKFIPVTGKMWKFIPKRAGKATKCVHLYGSQQYIISYGNLAIVTRATNYIFDKGVGFKRDPNSKIKLPTNEFMDLFKTAQQLIKKEHATKKLYVSIYAEKGNLVFEIVEFSKKDSPIYTHRFKAKSKKALKFYGKKGDYDIILSYDYMFSMAKFLSALNEKVIELYADKSTVMTDPTTFKVGDNFYYVMGMK